MLEIEKWAIDKPPLVAAMSIYFAFSADPLIEIIENACRGKLLDGFKVPPVKIWLKLYRNHRHVKNHVVSHLKGADYFSKTQATLYEDLTSKRKKKPKQNTKNEIERMRKEFLQVTIDAIKADINNEVVEGICPKTIDSLFQPELLFIFNVLFPCRFLYNEHPTFLLRKARTGDLDAIDKLLRLDKAVICDARISEQIFRLSKLATNHYFEKVIVALNSPPRNTTDKKTVVSKKKANYIMAGLVSLISEILGQRLKEKEIRALFEAVALDNGTYDTIEQDLALTPGAFSQAIRRERILWGFPL